MDYLKLFDQLYSECESIPDFPEEKAEKLWNTLPPFSRELAGTIYLLPFEDDLTEDAILRAKILSLLTLSAFIHGDLIKNRAFGEGEAVLYGDYLFALAFSMLPNSVTAEEGKEYLDQSFRFSENLIKYKNHDPEEADPCRKATECYGIHIAGIAEKAARDMGHTPETAKRYKECAKAIGTIWGILCEKETAVPAELPEKAEDLAKDLPFQNGILPIITIMKGAAIDHRENIKNSQ